MKQDSSDETTRPIYKYTLTDQYDMEHEAVGYAERSDGKTLFIETLFDGEKPHPNTKKWKRALLQPDGTMPFFLNGESL